MREQLSRRRCLYEMLSSKLNSLRTNNSMIKNEGNTPELDACLFPDIFLSQWIDEFMLISDSSASVSNVWVSPIYLSYHASIHIHNRNHTATHSCIQAVNFTCGNLKPNNWPACYTNHHEFLLENTREDISKNVNSCVIITTSMNEWIFFSELFLYLKLKCQVTPKVRPKVPSKMTITAGLLNSEFNIH